MHFAHHLRQIDRITIFGDESATAQAIRLFDKAILIKLTEKNNSCCRVLLQQRSRHIKTGQLLAKPDIDDGCIGLQVVVLINRLLRSFCLTDHRNSLPL